MRLQLFKVGLEAEEIKKPRWQESRRHVRTMSETATGFSGYPEKCNEFLKESQSFARDFYFLIRFATKIAG